MSRRYVRIDLEYEADPLRPLPDMVGRVRQVLATMELEDGVSPDIIFTLDSARPEALCEPRLPQRRR